MEKFLVTWLLLFCVSVLVKGDAGDQKSEFKVEPSSGGAKVTCPSGSKLYKDDKQHNNSQIYYKDSNSGEYVCKTDDNNIVIHQVFVKFRSCDNCIELDVASVAGMIAGNLVATFVIGVSVYLVAKHSPGGKSTPNKKGSDKQHLVTNEVGNDEHYQRLRPRNGRDIYDQLRK